MAGKIVMFTCLSLALFNIATAQCLNRVLPIAENFFPNQILLNQPCGCQNQVILPQNQLILPQNQLIVPQQNQLLLPQVPNVFLPQGQNVYLPQGCGQNVVLPQNNAVLSQNSVVLPQNNVILPQNNAVLSQNSVVLPQNNVILPQNNAVLPQNQVLLNSPYSVDVIPGSPSTTVIQDSTVANNLANALQLLVVSNLLSNTLPNPVEFAPIVAPNCGCGVPYNFIY